MIPLSITTAVVIVVAAAVIVVENCIHYLIIIMHFQSNERLAVSTGSLDYDNIENLKKKQYCKRLLSCQNIIANTKIRMLCPPSTPPAPGIFETQKISSYLHFR